MRKPMRVGSEEKGLRVQGSGFKIIRKSGLGS